MEALWYIIIPDNELFVVHSSNNIKIIELVSIEFLQFYFSF